MSIERSRNVKRVLVMLQYDEGGESEVIDITALALETAAAASEKHSNIELKVRARQDYSGSSPWPLKTDASWNVMINFTSSGDTAFIDDAVNASMPDSFATQELRKKRKRVDRTLKKLDEDIMTQRLLDAAKIRSTHPIARVTEAPALAAAAEIKTPAHF